MASTAQTVRNYVHASRFAPTEPGRVFWGKCALKAFQSRHGAVTLVKDNLPSPRVKAGDVKGAPVNLPGGTRKRAPRKAAQTA